MARPAAASGLRQISLILCHPDRALSEYGVESLGALDYLPALRPSTSGDLAIGAIRGLAKLPCEKPTPAESADGDVPAQLNPWPGANTTCRTWGSVRRLFGGTMVAADRARLIALCTASAGLPLKIR